MSRNCARSRTQKKFLLALLLVALGSAPSYLTAQNTPKTFYKKDFATDPGGKIDKGSKPDAGVDSRDAPQGAVPVATVGPGGGGFQSETFVAPQITSTTTTTIQRPVGVGIRVNGIGLIVNALDELHYQTMLQTLFRLSDTYDVPPLVVYAIGQGQPLGIKDHLMLSVYGSGMRSPEEPPAKYKVSRSPTWILGTLAGEILLEGIENPEYYINTAGEYVAPG